MKVPTLATRDQIRAARTIRGWGVRDLADAVQARFPKSRISFTTITRFEGGAESRRDTVKALQATLEAEGFTFVVGEAVGVTWPWDAPERWRAARISPSATTQER